MSSTLIDRRPVRFTREQYHLLADQGLFEDRRVELIDGEILELSPQKSRHMAAIRFAQRTLEPLLGAGFEVRTQGPLVLGDSSEPEPDIALVSGTADDYIEAHPTTALLVIEVADSSLRYDLKEKAELYARAGIADYWVVDLVNDRLHVLRDPTADADTAEYRRRSELGADDRITPLAASDVEIAVRDLLP